MSRAQPGPLGYNQNPMVMPEPLSQLKSQVEARLAALEADMELLEAENTRLRTNTASTYFERDACVNLLIRLARAQGMKAGRAERAKAHGTEKLVVLDLPAGQVQWEYLEAEAHLFADLPQYTDPVQDLTIQEVYAKVMNPGIDF